MNILPFSNDFTGEEQEQCACCKQWGWPDEVARHYIGDVMTHLCCNCSEEHGLAFESDILTPEQGKQLEVVIREHGTPMEQYLAEAKEELSRSAFRALKRRMRTVPGD